MKSFHSHLTKPNPYILVLDIVQKEKKALFFFVPRTYLFFPLGVHSFIVFVSDQQGVIQREGAQQRSSKVITKQTHG